MTLWVDPQLIPPAPASPKAVSANEKPAIIRNAAGGVFKSLVVKLPETMLVANT